MALASRREFLQFGAGLASVTRHLKAAGIARSSVQIGCCVPINQIQAAAQAGFDYIEPSAAVIAELTPDQFEQAKHDVLTSPLRCEAFNSFIRRKELVTVGPAVDMAGLKEYAALTLERCRQLGGKIVVWGSAGSRAVPEGFSRERAREQIAMFLEAIAPIAERHQIVISLEPLNRKESNILNTGAETLNLVNRVGRPQVRMIIDYYHLRMENEGLSIFERAGAKINHMHFANPTGRVWPKSPDEDAVYEQFFNTIRRLHWTGGNSIEGRGSIEANGRESLAFFRQELGVELRSRRRLADRQGC